MYVYTRRCRRLCCARYNRAQSLRERSATHRRNPTRRQKEKKKKRNKIKNKRRRSFSYYIPRALCCVPTLLRKEAIVTQQKDPHTQHSHQEWGRRTKKKERREGETCVVFLHNDGRSNMSLCVCMYTPEWGDCFSREDVFFWVD